MAAEFDSYCIGASISMASKLKIGHDLILQFIAEVAGGFTFLIGSIVFWSGITIAVNSTYHWAWGLGWMVGGLIALPSTWSIIEHKTHLDLVWRVILFLALTVGTMTLFSTMAGPAAYD